MPRRVNLPGAGELFRPTTAPTVSPQSPPPATVQQPTGRTRHDQKITVYLSTEELEAIEDARIVLRREHTISVDRGRIVRAAIAQALAELSSSGKDADLVRRLRQ